MLGPHLDEQVPVVGELPHRLGVVGQERRRSAEEPLVPGRRRGVVADRDTREQIHGHGIMLKAQMDGGHSSRSGAENHLADVGPGLDDLVCCRGFGQGDFGVHDGS